MSDTKYSLFVRVTGAYGEGDGKFYRKLDKVTKHCDSCGQKVKTTVSADMTRDNNWLNKTGEEFADYLYHSVPGGIYRGLEDGMKELAKK